MNPRFYFACCQYGAEKAVKAEVLEKFPHLRFAFSRPGFITFKEDDSSRRVLTPPPGAPTLTIFVRHWGVSIGQAKDREALRALVAGIPRGAVVHTFERDTFVPGDDPLGFVPRARIDAVWSELATTAPDAVAGLRRDEVPRVGETVYDLIWLDDFHVFLGTHVHAAGQDPSPGHLAPIELPPTAPSRAYLKLAEAIQRFGVPVRAGMSAVEIGCSPGGATSLMLGRGMSVLGIDPKEMDPSIYESANFRSVQKPAKAATAQDLLEFNPDWLVMDMNLAPLEAIDELTHVVRVLRKNYGKNLHVKTGFITLKLNDWKFAAQIPLYLKRLRELGFQKLTPMQLASNRQEFFVYCQEFR